MREKPTPSEGVKGDGKGKTVPQRIWRYCSYSTPSKGVTISLAFPTPSEGVNRQLPKPPVCASSMFGDNGSGRRLRAKHHESYRWPQLRADLKYSFINGTVSPFVALRGGMIIGTSYKGLGGYLRPSVGVDVWRFSLTLSYELMGNPHRKSYTDLSGATATESWRSNANNFNVGIAFRF